MMYESYTSDALRLLLESVTKQLGGQYPKLRYAELIGLVPIEEHEQQPEKTSDEIINKFVSDLSARGKNT